MSEAPVYVRRDIYLGIKIVTLSKLQALLVDELVKSYPQPVGHERLIARVWAGRKLPNNRSALDVMLFDLRRKAPGLIVNVIERGWKLTQPVFYCAG